MSTIECDVLVVGGGPAGCSAARTVAMKGLKTILIEEDEEIGYPVQCAEGIGSYLFEFMPFEIPKEQLIWKFNGILFWADDILIKKTGSYWEGFSVDRQKFDKWLSKLAIKNDTELLTNTKLIDLELDEENYVKKAIVKRNEKLVEILPKVVIAADGVESSVLKLLGLYNPKEGDLAEVYSWEMKNLDLFEPHFEQIYAGSFTPSGYAYIFPKSKDIANIGIGGLFPEKKLEDYYNEFLEVNRVKKQIKNAEFVIEKSKKAVWNDFSNKWIHGNVFLVGDAANQNLKPFIEGILPSVICGDIVGKISFDFITKKNVDHEYYLNKVKKTFGMHFSISKEMQEGIGYLFATKSKKKHLQFFGIVTELLKADEIETTKNMDYNELKSKLMGIKNGM